MCVRVATSMRRPQRAKEEIVKYWRSWRGTAASFSFLRNFKAILCNLAPGSISEITMALLKLLPSESATYRKRVPLSEVCLHCTCTIHVIHTFAITYRHIY